MTEGWKQTEGVVIDCQSMMESRWTGRVWSTTNFKEVQYEYMVDGITYNYNNPRQSVLK